MSELEALIAPSILASDFGQIAQECTRMVDGEGADWLHLGSPINLPLFRFVCLLPCLVDVMDGHFVPAITFGHQVVGVVRKALPDTYLDCHMMVSDPKQVSCCSLSVLSMPLACSLVFVYRSLLAFLYHWLE